MKLKKQHAKAVTIRPITDRFTGQSWIEVTTPERRFYVMYEINLYTLLDAVT